VPELLRRFVAQRLRPRSYYVRLFAGGVFQHDIVAPSTAFLPSRLRSGSSRAVREVLDE